MSNNIYGEGFFNEEQKERYLNNFDGNTRRVIDLVFIRAKELENTFNKDLFDFNIDEIEQFIHLLNCTSLNGVNNRWSVILNYINWAIREGLTLTNINPMQGISTLSYFKKFVSTEKFLITESELFEVIDGCYNNSDKALVLSVFEGIYGTEYAEIRNLKKEDIDVENKTIRLIDNGGNMRMIYDEDDFLVRTLSVAASTEKYIMNNGHVIDKKRKGRSHGVYSISGNTHVIKEMVQKTEDMPVDKHVISDRYAAIKKLFPEILSGIKLINLRNSGMLRMAYNIYKAKGTLTKEDLVPIYVRYNFINKQGKIKMVDYLERDFLNIETIKKVYHV